MKTITNPNICSFRAAARLSAALLLGLIATYGFTTNAALAESGPGVSALDEYRDGASTANAVQNRFFLKTGRFELAPLVGYVPNNPFAKRFVGSLGFGYHFSETFGIEGAFSYSPDLLEGDLKGLTSTLVEIAEGSDTAFQQPLDKVTLAAGFGITWSPLYGKINLFGETVLNFDFYTHLGMGMVSRINYTAKYNEDAGETGHTVALESHGNEVSPSPVIGLGANFFLNQTVALKLDTKFQMYVDNIPSYDIANPPTEKRLYNNFVASLGVAFFFPTMPPRLFNF